MPTKYSTVRSSLRTGDVALFDGKGRVSEIIKWRTGSPYSHAGTIYVASLNGGPTNVWLVHSTSIGSERDALSGRYGVKGLQISLLSQVVEHNYEERFALARVKSVFRVPGSPKREEADRLMLADLRKRIPYDTVQAIGAGIDWWDRYYENEEDWSALFCSEWVGLDHRRAGWLEPGINTSEQVPGDIPDWPHIVEPEEVVL